MKKAKLFAGIYLIILFVAFLVLVALFNFWAFVFLLVGLLAILAYGVLLSDSV